MAKPYYHSPLERWLDKHNHTMELIRTIVGVLSVTTSTVVLLRLFHYL